MTPNPERATASIPPGLDPRLEPPLENDAIGLAVLVLVIAAVALAPQPQRIRNAAIVGAVVTTLAVIAIAWLWPALQAHELYITSATR